MFVTLFSLFKALGIIAGLTLLGLLFLIASPVLILVVVSFAIGIVIMAVLFMKPPDRDIDAK